MEGIRISWWEWEYGGNIIRIFFQFLVFYVVHNYEIETGQPLTQSETQNSKAHIIVIIEVQFTIKIL